MVQYWSYHQLSSSYLSKNVRGGAHIVPVRWEHPPVEEPIGKGKRVLAIGMVLDVIQAKPSGILLCFHLSNSLAESGTSIDENSELETDGREIRTYRHAEQERHYFSLARFSMFFSGLLCSFSLELSVTLLWWTNSEKEGICGKSREQLWLIGAVSRTCSVVAPWLSLSVTSLFPVLGEEAEGSSSCLDLLAEGEGSLMPKWFVSSMESAVESHLTVLATCEQ